MPLSRRLAVVLVALVVAGCGPDRAPVAPTSGETSSPPGGGVGASAGAGVSVPPSGAGAGGSSPPSAAVPGSPSAGGGATTIGLETVVDDLDAPLDVSWRPAPPDDLYVVEQPGRIRPAPEGARRPHPS